MSPERLSVCLFGLPVFEWRGQSFDVPTRKSNALLCYVALSGATPRANLSELLWGVGQQRNLRLELHRLRQLPGAASWLLTDTSVHINAQTDVAAFEAALGERDFAGALSVHGGAPEQLLVRDLEPRAAPAFQDWLEGERRRVAVLLGDALRGLLEQLEGAGKQGEALERARQLLTLDPLDESAHRTVMRLEWQLGNIGAAQAQFERCRRILAEELGLSPMPETEMLAVAIENALSDTPKGRPETATLRRIPPELLRPPVLVGRDAEWAMLERAWERKQAVYIYGPPGVGKTRLLLDFAQAKTAGNFSLVQGLVGDKSVPMSTLARAWHSYFEAHPAATEQLEPWVKREVARFLPETFNFTISAIQTEQAQLRFMSAVYALFFEKCMRVDANLADDLQFFDSTSFYLSAYAVGRLVREGLPGRDVHTLMAFRSDELSPPFFEAIATQVAADRAIHIRLEPLSVEATRTLLSSLELPDDSASGAELRRATGGNPLFIVEVLRDQFEKQAFGKRERLPERINLQIGDRLGRLSPKSLYLARLLAALQDFTTPELLEAVLDTDVFELSEGLSELERAQMIKGLAFSHTLIYEAVVQNTPSAVTQLIHHKIATTLEAAGGRPARIAHHWNSSAQPERALVWYLRAAEIAVTQGSFDKAQEWLERVLEVDDDQGDLYQQAKMLLSATKLTS